MNRDQIHTEILNEISNHYDKRAGTFIYLVTRPVAIVLEKVYQRLEAMKEKLDIENLSGDELAKRIKERTGIERRQATYAIGKVTVTGNGIVYIGDLFETENGIQFEATETVPIVNVGTVKIKAIVTGETGNVPVGQIVHMPVTLEGINSVTNHEVTYDGFNAENDADLLERYYERIRTPATSGNKHHYLNWAKSVNGVGDARVYPLWDGDNTVKIVVINSDRQPASNEIVNRVQNYIDKNSGGLGEGEAPIGAYCTVESAIGLGINISLTVLLVNGFSQEEVKQAIETNIVNYLKEIAFKQDFVSYAQIGSIIVNTEGVADYTNYLMNGGTSNITIKDEEVAVLGGVEIV